VAYLTRYFQAAAASRNIMPETADAEKAFVPGDQGHGTYFFSTLPD
jgi:hypothetical protein